MKVRGDNAPANAFSLEEQPDKPGYCLVRFYENVAPFSETQGELTISGFEYDEYYLELPFYDGIYDDILGSFVMSGWATWSPCSTAISRRRS